MLPETETQITTQMIPPMTATADQVPVNATVPPDNFYPLDEPTYEVKIKSGILAGKPSFATLTVRRPSEKELIEREKNSVASGRQINKDEVLMDTGDASQELALATKIVLSISGFDLKDGLARHETRNVNADLAKRIPASMRLAALRGLYNSTCAVYTLDLENGLAIIKQEIGTEEDPDFTIFHTLDISDEALISSYKSRTQKHSVNSKDPRVQKTIFKSDLAKIVEFYNNCFVELEGASINGLPASNKQQTLGLIDAYFKRQVMQCVTQALETGLQD